MDCATFKTSCFYQFIIIAECLLYSGCFVRMHHGGFRFMGCEGFSRIQKHTDLDGAKHHHLAQSARGDTPIGLLHQPVSHVIMIHNHSIFTCTWKTGKDSLHFFKTYYPTVHTFTFSPPHCSLNVKLLSAGYASPVKWCFNNYAWK